MEEEIYSGTAWIEIQGERVLHFLRLESDYAEYQVIGFLDPIIIRDFRIEGHRAIQEVLDTNKVDSFASLFNSPARIKVNKTGPRTFLIELDDTGDPDPTHRLWIAIGLDEYLPVYDYLLNRLAPLAENRFALCALYRRPQSVHVLSPVVVATS
jgi:hypothetical protein